jgi:hypothetical protein
LFDLYLADYEGTDSVVTNYCQNLLLTLVESQPAYWNFVPSFFRARPGNSHKSVSWAYQRVDQSSIKRMPIAVANIIAADPTGYDMGLCKLVDRRFQIEVERSVGPVAKVASRDRWFA